MPYDVFRIAQFFNLSSDEVLNEFCTVSLGKKSKIPSVSVKTKHIEIENKTMEICPFLLCNENNRSYICTIEDVKPIACEVFPLNTIVSIRKEEVGVDYFLQPNKACKGLLESKEVTLKQWEDNTNMDNTKIVFRHVTDCISVAGNILDFKRFFNSSKISQELKDEFFNDFINTLYSSLNIKKDIATEIRDRCKLIPIMAEKMVCKLENKGIIL
jgi:Fe-S-cluster containining protein